MKNGIDQGQRPELVGGGLIRSMGGWSVVKSLRRRGVEEKGDARILGSSDFVMQVIDEADQHIRHQFDGPDLIAQARKIINDYCAEHDVSVKALRNGSRRRNVSVVRKKLEIQLVHEIGLTLAETGRQVGLTTSGVAQILRRNSK